MDRRSFLRAASATGLAGTAATAGCLGFELSQGGVPPVLEERPDAVYYPTHVEAMEMAGMGSGGDYAVAVMYSLPHRFWNVNGESVERTDIRQDDAVHLMAAVWDPGSGKVLPDTGLSVEILQGGDLVSQEVIYPMLSQPMGFHYGANFPLPEDGTYTVRADVGAVGTRKTGDFREKFAEPAQIDVEFEYSESTVNDIEVRNLDNAGEPGAVEPMSMDMVPNSMAPETGDLPGRLLGEATSNDAVLVATVLDSPPSGVDGDGSYLAVSARTPYNRMLLPAMALDATLTRGGESVYDDALTATLDPDLSYHYGAVVDGVESGDELELTPTVQPQTARHEGYETAFGALLGGMPPATISVEG
ncbi:hypothetical protein HUG10_18990 (plasmid) [Halorarum halophilum]|uniref:DUF7350 domain-containing protein n=1 Tax=Halorarum halophilum TaxID=2743090 RepID=A0A7D5H3F3_9EURY|nr:hypothetical protein [Halobaculum halophilum]QLG29693.1 hypothetical protein HUG10_18990 [Halobaculum halophilum]